MVDGLIELAKTIRPPPRKEMSHVYIVKQSEEICKTLNALQLRKILSDMYWKHLESILCSVFMLGYRGKESKALRVFISTHTELSTQEILSLYVKRWHIEVFFRACKQKLAFDKCQLRKKTGITRMWLILSFAHFICCAVVGYVGDFDEGYRYFRNCVLQVALAQNRNSL